MILGGERGYRHQNKGEREISGDEFFSHDALPWGWLERWW
jgi:hypothetical protein